MSSILDKVIESASFYKTEMLNTDYKQIEFQMLNLFIG
jgi:hypothetical protein